MGMKYPTAPKKRVSETRVGLSRITRTDAPKRERAEKYAESHTEYSYLSTHRTGNGKKSESSRSDEVPGT